MQFRLRRATGPDIVNVATRLFLAPAGGRYAAKRLIESCALSSVWAAVGPDEGPAVGLWGGAPSQNDGSVASFWMLALEPLDGSPEMVRLGRLAVEELLDSYDRLESFIEANRWASLRFMEEIGFTIDPPVMEEPTGRLLHRVWLVRLA